jgi:hypothetical protein
MNGARVPQVKGVSFRTVLTVVEKHRGRALVDAALNEMAPEVRDAHRFGTIIAAGWYPVAWYREMWRALRKVGGGGDELVRSIGRAAIDHDFNTIYRTLFRVLSAKTLVSIGIRHFSNIYDTGAVEVVDDQPSSVRVRWWGCTDFDHAMWIEILGSCERLAELAGGKQAQSTIHEGGRDGDDRCVATVAWR